VWHDQDVVEPGNCATAITTDRLVVRPWRLDEADRFFDIYRRPEVVRWLGTEPMQNRREAIETIQRNLARLAADCRFGSWAVVDRSSGVPVGSVIFKALPNGEGEIEIGWQLHPDSLGKGYASAAAAAVLKRGFADGLREVWAVTHLDDHRPATYPCTRTYPLKSGKDVCSDSRRSRRCIRDPLRSARRWPHINLLWPLARNGSRGRHQLRTAKSLASTRNPTALGGERLLSAPTTPRPDRRGRI
jgi:RimJ/RimL family protein N-acetyltransferase